MMLARPGLPTIAAFLAPLLLAYAWPGLKARAQDMDAEQHVVSVGGTSLSPGGPTAGKAYVAQFPQ